MSGESFEQLLAYGSNPRLAIESPLTRQAVQDAVATQRQYVRNAQVAQYERGINAAIDRHMLEREAEMAKFGTTDQDKIAALRATGILDNDFNNRIQMDPEGARAAYDRAAAITGLNEVQKAAEAIPDTFLKGTGPHGEPFYTNRSLGELKEEERQRAALQGRAPQKPISNPRVIHPEQLPGGTISAGPSGPMARARQAFEGKMANLEGMVTRTERNTARAVARDKYIDEVLLHAATKSDAGSALERVKSDLETGVLKKMGLGVADAAAASQAITQRAKTPNELATAAPYLPLTELIPWKRPKDAGELSDPTQPSSVVNPKGGPSIMDRAEARLEQARVARDQTISDSLEKELPRTAQYARGAKAPPSQRANLSSSPPGTNTVYPIDAFVPSSPEATPTLNIPPTAAPTPRETPQGPPAVASTAGAEALTEPFEDDAFTRGVKAEASWRDGAGRHGHGESGPVGLAKDVAAFYGPRLPGDLFSAMLMTEAPLMPFKAAGKARQIYKIFKALKKAP